MSLMGEFDALVCEGRKPLEVAHLFWDAACEYIESEGDESILTGYFGSIGQFLSCGDGFADWLFQLGIDPYPFWDWRLGLEYSIDGDNAPSFLELSRLGDRAVLCMIQAQLTPGNDLDPASASKLFKGLIPTNPDIVDLASRIDSEADSKRDWIDIAREFTGEDAGEDRKAKSLLASIRRLRRQGRLRLTREQ